MKYVYCIPRGGFVDQLGMVKVALDYCNKYNRILLVDGMKSTYNINYINYFNLPYENIVYDSTNIRNILSNDNFSIYPDIFKGQINNILEDKIIYDYSPKAFKYKNTELDLPASDISQNIIVFVRCGGGDRFRYIFGDISFQPKIKQIISDRYKTLKKPYLSIQIRNTDYKCDYELLYENNKTEIHSATEIYIATDDKKALKFFIDKGLPVKNFTTFPVASEYRSLHSSQLDPHIKFIDMLSDVYICGMSDKLISSSCGGFIRLIRSCNENKSALSRQFEIIDE